jgi:hypothetical protein
MEAHLAQRRTILLSLLVAFALGVVMLAATRHSVIPAAADSTSAAMSLGVNPPDGCDQNPAPTSCSIPVQGTFTVSVNVDSLPGGGYAGVQTELFYDGLTYKPDPVADEIVWPQSASPIRFPVSPTGTEHTVYHGDVTALQTPFPASNFTGAFVQIRLTCPAQPQEFTVALLTYSQSQLLGAGFELVDQTGQLGPTVPAKTAGQRALDLDGNAQTPAVSVDVADALTIGCGIDVATATPTIPPTATATSTPTSTATAPPNATATNTATSTATRTATRTPTRTPTSPAGGDAGDANCDRRVTSVDSAVVLQKDAGLIAAVPCPENADVNHDGRTNSVDASVILQFVAGLLSHLPA